MRRRSLSCFLGVVLAAGLVTGSAGTSAAASQVVAEPKKVSAVLAWPHPKTQQVTRHITYANQGRGAVTLKLSITARRAGKPVGRHPFRLGRTKVTVPARGKTTVRLIVHGGGVPAVRYTGTVTARSAKPKLAVKTGLLADIRPRPTPKPNPTPRPTPTPTPPPVGPGGPRLRVAVLDRTGKPVSAMMQLRSLGSTSSQGLPTGFVTGQSVLLPPGDYLAVGRVESGDGSMTVVAGTVRHDRDVDLTLDARRAKPIRIAVGEPAARPVTSRISIGREHDQVQVGVDVRKPLYVLPAPWNGLAYNFHSVWAKDGVMEGSPYVYELADMRDSGVPSDPMVQLDDSRLAKVVTTYRAHDQQNGSIEVRTLAAASRQSTFHGLTGHHYPRPTTLVRYRTPGVPYLTFLFGESRVDTETKTYSAGTSTEVWNDAVLYPLPNDPRWNGDKGWLANRQDNLIHFLPPSFCGHGRGGGYTWCDGKRFTSTLTGSSGQSFTKNDHSYRVPSTPDTYTLTGSFDREARLASRIDMSWTFRSEKDNRALPLYTVRQSPQGLDDLNRAQSGSRTTIPLNVEGPPGTAPNIEELRVHASADDGATWFPLDVTHTDAGWEATIVNPGTPGFVTLRTTAIDHNGTAVTQTIHRAYEISG